MNMSIKKRMALGAGAIATVAAVGTLVAGVTFGFFSASQTSGGNTFTAGTVTMSTPLTSTCDVGHVLPGDSGTCTINATYTGADLANLGLDVSVSGSGAASVPQAYGYAGTNAPAAGLYDDSINGLQISLTDSNSTSYNLGGLTSANSSTSDLLVAQAAPANTSDTFTLHWSVANNGGIDNNYQGASSSFTFTVHAVQSDNNASTGTLGQVDNSISWS